MAKCVTFVILESNAQSIHYKGVKATNLLNKKLIMYWKRVNTRDNLKSQDWKRERTKNKTINKLRINDNYIILNCT